jgi:YfiH family protein
VSVDWLPADWPPPAGVVAGCTLRTGGVSRGAYRSLNLGDHVGDDPHDVAENRRRFVAGIGLPAEPHWLAQVHGSTVRVDPAAGEEGDACYTRAADVVCAVLVADCLPVLMAAQDGSEVAAAHAGWRGLAAGVIENTLARFASSPEDIRAWLGPAIAEPAFEVGDEVREAFRRQDEGAGACFRRNERGRWQADLYGLARRRLARAGVRQVYGGRACTHAEARRFFSYRRDGQCGRMAAFIYRAARNA